MSYVGVPQGVELDGGALFFTHVHLHGGPAPVRRYLPQLIDLVLKGTINPGKVFDQTLPLAQVPNSTARWRSGAPSRRYSRPEADAMRICKGLCIMLGLLILGGYEARRSVTSGSTATTAVSATPPSVRPEESRMWMPVGERRFAITVTDNAAARAFASRLPLTLDMSELNGNEKYADLQDALPANASRPGTIRNGDLMLYGTNTVVVFYATFNSTYSYTRLGGVDDPADLPQALGRRGVRVVLSNE